MNVEAGESGAGSRNPYSPPGATVADAAVTVNDAPRPGAIWVLQIMALVPIVALILGMFRTAQVLSAIRMRGINSAALLLGLGFRLVTLALLLWMMIGLHRRWQSGRWLAVLPLAGLIVFLGVIVFQQPRSDHEQTVGFAFGIFLAFALMAAIPAQLMYSSLFCAKARAYFAKPR